MISKLVVDSLLNEDQSFNDTAESQNNNANSNHNSSIEMSNDGQLMQRQPIQYKRKKGKIVYVRKN